jgi:hypothetical protein
MNLPFAKGLIWLYLEQQTDEFIEQQFDEITLPLPDPDILAEHKEAAAALPLSPAILKRLGHKKFEQTDYQIFQKIGYGEAYLKTTCSCDKETGLQDLWNEVHRLLRNPVARTAVDVGILCKYRFEDLVPMVSGTFHEVLTEKGLELYQKYFFDAASMTKLDWRAYLRICAGIPYLYLRIHTALTKPKKEAMHLAGLPAKAAFADFLKTVLATAEYKFEYYSRHNNQCSDNQARAWAKIGFDAGVKYEKFSASDVTDFSKAVQTEFESFNAEIPTISTDMLSEVKPPETEVESKSKAPPVPVLAPDTEV